MGEGNLNLYDLLVELSGLDRKVIDQELGQLIKKLNLDPNNLSTDDIRQIATLYLFEIQSSTGSEVSLLDELVHGDELLRCQAEA